MSRDQNAGQSHNIKIDNRSLEKLEEFKYLGTTLTNQNSILLVVSSCECSNEPSGSVKCGECLDLLNTS